MQMCEPPSCVVEVNSGVHFFDSTVVITDTVVTVKPAEQGNGLPVIFNGTAGAFPMFTLGSGAMLNMYNAEIHNFGGGAISASDGAAVVLEEIRLTLKKAGFGVPAGFLPDKDTGYYYSSESGYFFDAATKLYYHPNTQLW